VAQAAEKCVLDGVSEQPSITAAALDGLCQSTPSYVAAANQTAPSDLAAAVNAAASLSASLPSPTGSAGGNGTSGGAGGSGGSGTSGGYRMADGSSSVVMVGMTAIAAVVLATAAAF
jgi:hypothetical protein